MIETFNINELEEIRQLNPANKLLIDTIDVLLAAINDWPTAIINLNDYNTEVEAFIGGKANKRNIQSALSKIDYAKNAWKAESLFQATQALEYYNVEISLNELIEEMKLKYSRDNPLEE